MNNPIFKLYIKKLQYKVSLDAFNQLKQASKNQKAKGGKGKELVFNIDQFLEGAGRLLRIFVIFLGLAKVRNKQ